jgi:hypothetical protein
MSQIDATAAKHALWSFLTHSHYTELIITISYGNLYKYYFDHMIYKKRLNLSHFKKDLFDTISSKTNNSYADDPSAIAISKFQRQKFFSEIKESVEFREMTESLI